MKAADLDLLELLDLNPEIGSIKFKNRRMLLWDADAFGILRKELIDSLGLERARQILRRFGFANGYRDGLTTGDEVALGTDPFNDDSDGDGIADDKDPKPLEYNLPPSAGMGGQAGLKL